MRRRRTPGKLIGVCVNAQVNVHFTRARVRMLNIATLCATQRVVTYTIHPSARCFVYKTPLSIQIFMAYETNETTPTIFPFPQRWFILPSRKNAQRLGKLWTSTHHQEYWNGWMLLPLHLSQKIANASVRCGLDITRQRQRRRSSWISRLRVWLNRQIGKSTMYYMMVVWSVIRMCV